MQKAAQSDKRDKDIAYAKGAIEIQQHHSISSIDKQQQQQQQQQAEALPVN